MLCPVCKTFLARENNFCPRCGALVPRENSDVAKYVNFNIYGEKRTNNRPLVKEKTSEKNIIRQLPSAWKEIQEIIKQQQNPQIKEEERRGAFYGNGEKLSQGKPPYTPHDDASGRQPQYRMATQQPVQVKTMKKKTSSVSGFIIFIIIAAVFIIPNILCKKDFGDDGYFYNTEIVSMSSEYTLLNYTLTDVHLSKISVTRDYVESFTLSFKGVNPDSIWYEPLQMDFVGEGEIVFADSQPHKAVFDGLTISVPNCNLDFNTKHILLYISYYDYKADHEHMFFMPEDKEVLIFKEDATYEFKNGNISY